LGFRYEWDEEDKAAHVVKGRLKGTGDEVIRKYIEYSKTGQGTPYHVIRETTILKGLQVHSISPLPLVPPLYHPLRHPLHHPLHHP